MSPNTIRTIASTNDLGILIGNIQHIQHQLDKLQEYNDWARMDLGINKRVVSECPNKSKVQPLAFTAYLKAQHINVKDTSFYLISKTKYPYFLP